jgi:hypothetical protein
VVSSSVLMNMGTIMSLNGLERMAVLNHKLDQINVIMYWHLAINSFMCNNDNYVDYH